MIKNARTTIIGVALIGFGGWLAVNGSPADVFGAWLGGGLGLIMARDA